MNNDKRKAPVLNVNIPLRILLKEYKGEKDFFHKALCACSNCVSLIFLGLNATLYPL